MSNDFKTSLRKYTVSLGSRLYGYHINNSDNDLKYNPLFIKASGTNVVDVGDGSYLGRSSAKFPPQMYQDLYTNLVGIATPSSRTSPPNNPLSPQENSGVPLVTLSTNPPELGTSALIINSVNTLQYLYNSDPAYFDVADSGNPEQWLGKKYEASSMSSGVISEVLQKYKEKFDLKDLEFYMRVVPIDLETEELITSYSNIKCQKATYDGTTFNTQEYTCPTDSGHTLILSRPRLLPPENPGLKFQIAEGLALVGNRNIGFEIKVNLKYKKDEQDFSCETMRRFSHPNKPITGLLTESNPLTVEVTKLENGTKDLLNDTRKQTSCDTDGGGYKNITLGLDFKEFKRPSGNYREEFGTVLLCKGKTSCRSDTEDSYGSCNVSETGWQRCHTFKFEEQNGNTDAKLLADDKLELTFNNLTENRRYDLFIIEVSMLEWSRASVELNPNDSSTNIGIDGIDTIRFYIDAKRPEIVSHIIDDDDVGQPTDGGPSRNYGGNPKTNWETPPGSTDKWLQCNQSPVNFIAKIEDQFIHNLKPCTYEAKRKNGDGEIDISGNVRNGPFDFRESKCNARLSNIDHGRQAINSIPHDTCDEGVRKKLVWDTDLPNTFKEKPVASKWFRSTEKISYNIETKIPAKTQKGKFPKHYSVDCVDKEYDPRTRTDGDGKTLSCKLLTGKADRDDGCNPEKIGVRYYHVCGDNQCKGAQWGVFVPHQKSCKNVQCEPDLICCDGYKNDCGSVGKEECEKDQYPHDCSPKRGGDRSYQREAECPPLGLYNCGYKVPCYATNPYSKTDVCEACQGKIETNSCTFTRPFTCHLLGSSTGSSASFPGICRTDSSYTKSCTITGTCTRWDQESYDCNCRNVNCDSNGQNCTNVCNTCTRTVCGQYTAPSTGTCSVTFTGNCGPASGGCPRLGVGGGNLSAEKCDVRNPGCQSHLGLGGEGPGNPANPGACSGSQDGPLPPGAPPIIQTIQPDQPCDSSQRCCTGDTFCNNPDNCPPAPPVNGVCSQTAPWFCDCGHVPECLSCNPIINMQVGANGTMTWQCQGMHGGSDSPVCSRGGPACASEEQHACRDSAPVNFRMEGDYYRWDCQGLYGGQIVKIPCKRALTDMDPIDGRCAQKCIGEGCSVGNKTNESSDGSTWTCEGLLRGESENCTKNECGTLINGGCSATGCITGTKRPTESGWECTGENGGSNAQCGSGVTCGQCGKDVDECSSGNFHNHPPHTDDEYRWTCRNDPHTADDSCGGLREDLCTESKGGDCDPNAGCCSEDTCCTGDTHPTNPNCSQCTGTNEYKTEAACKNGIPDDEDCREKTNNCWERFDEEDVPTATTTTTTTTTDEGGGGGGSVVCGACGTWSDASNASCSSGDFHGHPDDTTEKFKWTCRNKPHERSDNCNKKREVECSADKPTQKIIGSCDSYEGDSNSSCSAGNFNAHPGHTDTQYKWTCRSIPHTSPNREIECSEAKLTATDVCEPSGSGLQCFPCRGQFQAHNTNVTRVGGGNRDCTWDCKGTGYRAGETFSCTCMFCNMP